MLDAYKPYSSRIVSKALYCITLVDDIPVELLWLRW